MRGKMKRVAVSVSMVLSLVSFIETADAFLEGGYPLYNSFFGTAAGQGNYSGSSNSFFGANAGGGNSTGNHNSSFGGGAGYYNNGSQNTFIGAFAGHHNYNGNWNTFVGYYSGFDNSGYANVFIGANAGRDEMFGSDRLYIDNCYLTDGDGKCTRPLIYGEFNNRIVNIDGMLTATSFVGNGSGLENVTATTVQYGVYTNNSYTDPPWITSISGSKITGTVASATNATTVSNGVYTTGSYANPSWITSLDASKITGSTDNKIGSNTTNYVPRWNGSQLVSGIIQDTGSAATVNGHLTAAGPIWSTSGGIKFPDGTTQTTAVTGVSTATNSYFGQDAGRVNTGTNDTFLGSGAGYANTSGGLNTFVGNDAGRSNVGGTANTFMGHEAGYYNQDGNWNVFIGKGAGYNNSHGSTNVAIGAFAGRDNETGYKNVFLGPNAGAAETGSNKLYIDNCAVMDELSRCVPLIYGEFDNRVVKVNGALFIASDERMKEKIEPLTSSLEKVMHLRGVSYERKAAGDPEARSKSREIGLIAQNVESVVPELVHTDGQGYKAVAYDKMVAVLVEAVKEQQAKIKDQHQRIEEQQRDIDEKDARIEKLARDNERIVKALEKLALQVAAIEGSGRTVARK